MGGHGATRLPEEVADTGIWLVKLGYMGPTERFFRGRKEIPWGKQPIGRVGQRQKCTGNGSYKVSKSGAQKSEMRPPSGERFVLFAKVQVSGLLAAAHHAKAAEGSQKQDTSGWKWHGGR